MHSRRRDLGIFWFLSALWSGNWLWIKVGLAGLPPFRFAGLRLALACSGTSGSRREPRRAAFLFSRESSS